MEVFTLCNCDNMTNSYVAYYKQKTIRRRNQKKIAQCERALRKKVRLQSNNAPYLHIHYRYKLLV